MLISVYLVITNTSSKSDIPRLALAYCAAVKRPDPTILCSRPNNGFRKTENVKAFGR